MSPGFTRLSEIEENIMNKFSLTKESIEKIKSTAEYSLNQDPDQDPKEVVKRCMIAQMAEQYVAEHMEGWFSSGDEDVSEPLTYAFDVLAPMKYNGIRIEVKTHQSGSKWISVSTGASGKYPGKTGINVGPFLQHKVADVIIFFDVEDFGQGHYKLIPRLMADQIALEECITKSKYTGYYLNTRIGTSAIGKNIHTF